MDEMDEIINDFIAEAQEDLESLDHKFVQLEKTPGDTALLNDIFRTVHTIKGAAGFLGFEDIVTVSHSGEDILNKLRKGEMEMTPSIMDGILAATDIIGVMINNLKEHNNKKEKYEPVVKILEGLLAGGGKEAPKAKPAKAAKKSAVKPAKKAAAMKAEPKAGKKAVKGKAAKKKKDGAVEEVAAEVEETVEEIATPVAADAESKPVAAQTSESSHVEQTIRVDTSRIDAVMNMIGELVLSRNRMMVLGNKLGLEHSENQTVSNMNDAIAQLDLATTDLQLSVMKMRMQPIAKVFNKFPRMVRDMARQSGKEIELIVEGQETELDKTVIEELGDPLVHLIRNSVDHGVEMPDVREAAGKSRGGTITLSASQEGRHIVVSVVDDGNGIDADAIKASAASKGLISIDDAIRMTDKEAYNLIFLPGFSTAKEVSNLSGRGVGMDVVKTNMAKINGVISVESEVGVGTKIIFRLPLTLAIIQVLTVEAGDEIYGIPLTTVIENRRVEDSEIKSVEGGEVVQIRDRVYPVLRLSSLVTSNATEDDTSDCKYIVIIGVGEQQLGLIVDRLHGQEEIVMKSMGEYLKGTEGVAGACITGDGRVILILDISGFVESMTGRFAH
jgi:two-component system chemotaxis sensor kinase CheA